MFGLILLNLLFFEVFATPCPSTKCWNFNTARQTCELLSNPECYSVTCGETTMEIKMIKGFSFLIEKIFKYTTTGVILASKGAKQVSQAEI